MGSYDNHSGHVSCSFRMRSLQFAYAVGLDILLLQTHTYFYKAINRVETTLKRTTYSVADKTT